MTDRDRINHGICDLSTWIDTSYGLLNHEAADLRRIGKVASEAAEAWDAYAAMTGENPRKGVHGTQAQVEYELLDAAVAALGALVHLRGNDPSFDVAARLADHVGAVCARAGLL